MSQLELCRSELSCILDYVAFGIMSHSGLCHIWDYVAFSIALFGIVSFLLMLLCYVIWDYVVRYTVGVSYNYHTRIIGELQLIESSAIPKNEKSSNKFACYIHF